MLHAEAERRRKEEDTLALRRSAASGAEERVRELERRRERIIGGVATSNVQEAGYSEAAPFTPGIALDDRLAADDDEATGPQSIPDGWTKCPAIGYVVPGTRLIPCKVPLGVKFDGVVGAAHFTPSDVIMHSIKIGKPLGLVIDLSNTDRYYSVREWDETGVRHVPIRCAGRNETPDASMVRIFLSEVASFEASCPDKYILVHCTHGHNRTGFMIVHYLIELRGWTLNQALGIFSASREPGIYKEDYVKELCRQCRVEFDASFHRTVLPYWKVNAEQCDDYSFKSDMKWESLMTGAERSADENHCGGVAIEHDDVIGVHVDWATQKFLQKWCQVSLGFIRVGKNGELIFPGSQPVSLARRNLHFLSDKRYLVSWKADGTRYMLLSTVDGVFVTDRTFSFRKVECFLPRRDWTGPNHRMKSSEAARLHIDKCHDYTLLDGEMVVDKYKMVDGKLVNAKDDGDPALSRRRYLVYDAMVINGRPVASLSFKERLDLIKLEVTGPRDSLGDCVRGSKRIDFSRETFSIREKQFASLCNLDRVLADSQGYPHETDGLILQPEEDPYVPGTYDALLKWKYSHMNSVDFFMDSSFILHVLEDGRLKPLPQEKIIFSSEDERNNMKDCVIECGPHPTLWPGAWLFMRERRDKDTPNAYFVYKKVIESIEDKITEDNLKDFVNGLTTDQDLHAKGVLAAPEGSRQFGQKSSNSMNGGGGEDRKRRRVIQRSK